jgi:hypothetical protein
MTEHSVVHLAAPMSHGVQRCNRCLDVLADETGLDVRPGSSRYTPGLPVLVMTGEDYRVTAPYTEDLRLPPNTLPCTSSTQKD